MRETLALVDKYESWMDGTCIKVGEGDLITAFVSGSRFAFEESAAYYKTVNVYKFSRHFSEIHYVPFLEAYVKALGNNEYYEQVLRVNTMLDEPEIKAKRLNGKLWYEIDDIQDLDIASSMFMEDGAEKMRTMQLRYGGYWRYPRLIDFCYLVNPYFPPQRLIDEMKANYGMPRSWRRGAGCCVISVLGRMSAMCMTRSATITGLQICRQIKADNREVQKLLTEEGIGLRTVFWWMHEQPVYQKKGLFKDERYPNAEYLARKGFYIPSGLALTEKQMEKVVEGVRRVMANMSYFESI